MVKMPQRQRHHTGGGTAGAELPLLEPGVLEAHNTATTRCCIPLSSNCLRGYQPISLTSPVGCVRVLCNNENCRIAGFMHKECFQAWENHVLAYLRSCGRARSWSEKQRLQNLWTKRGYDLAYRACSCLCGRGHLRKDLDWAAPPEPEEDIKTVGKKKKKNRQNQKPALVTVGIPLPPAQTRNRANSLSSTGSSPPSDVPSSPHHQVNANININRNTNFERDRHGSGGSIIGGKVVSSNGGVLANTGMFARRPNFCSFNALPRCKINSYHIKNSADAAAATTTTADAVAASMEPLVMEDDSSHGNDETRGFILTTLAAHRTARTSCVLCQQTLLVFDRYPLIDGTFFLTPLQHSRAAIPVDVEGRRQFLSAVCLGCLEGSTSELRCLRCTRRWSGAQLILGTMYSYDIFAATPCCIDRLRCSRCQCPVISPDQKLSFFSEYSRMRACPNCALYDHHFVKPLSAAFSIESDPSRL